MSYKILLCLSLILVPIIGCQKLDHKSAFSSEDSLKLVQEILNYRAEKDSFFKYSNDSPFNRDTSIQYKGLNYYKPDLRFYFKSKLYKYEKPETVIVLGTKGEERKQLKYGYFKLFYEGKEYKINVYKFTTYESIRYKLYKDNLSFWFRDKTTGHETYEVGRYVEIGNENPDPEYLYTIDLNKAFNPYCAYSPMYSCAIPREEDYLDFEVKAGEKKYH